MDVAQRVEACRKRLQSLDGFPLLESERLQLRAPREQDVATTFALFSDPTVMRYWSRSAMTDEQEAVEYLDGIARGFHERSFINWIVVDRAEHRMVGTCTLYEIMPQHLRTGIGYAILPEAQGRGFASEAVHMAVSWAFEVLGLHRVEADIHPDNLPSRRVLERCGFHEEGLLRERFCTASEIQHSLVFGRLVSDPTPARAPRRVGGPAEDSGPMLA
ncbi:MAG: GNAT family N-acetyltransferase [Xanthomonadales bacterium]|nr:GNAT family N-acetyltransferase [Xanthomonadales bacterium]